MSRVDPDALSSVLVGQTLHTLYRSSNAGHQKHVENGGRNVPVTSPHGYFTVVLKCYPLSLENSQTHQVLSPRLKIYHRIVSAE